MKHLITVAMAASCLGVAVPGADAQTVKDLVGIWTLESDTNATPDGRTIQVFGPNPQGIAIFDSNGHFAIINSRSDLPKFALTAGFRAWPIWDGTDQKRAITAFAGDKQTWTTVASIGGKSELHWKRLK